MDTMATWPALRACKDRTLEVLSGRAPVLDVGCGVGEDARALGAIGLDASATMLGEAKARGGAFVRGDALMLPVATASLDGVLTDRVLQHVGDPELAVLEIARVLGDGGLAALAEPDQSTLAIDGTDQALTADIVAFRTNSIRNAFLGGELQRRLDRLGFRDIGRQAFTVEVRDPALAFGLPTWPGMLVESGAWTAGQRDQFLSTLDAPDFSYRVDLVLTWATR
jgi:ubiquinone/menaquinone biosynthesis C-methylase UbiE